jgi:hypothetical protein
VVFTSYCVWVGRRGVLQSCVGGPSGGVAVVCGRVFISKFQLQKKNSRILVDRCMYVLYDLIAGWTTHFPWA